MNKVTALIICKNEEKNIKDCIQSILWCDEIVVIDSFSTDNTVNIANSLNVSVIQNEWKGFSEQRKFSLTKANHEWIFSIDADERCTKKLEDEIKDLLKENNIKQSGFEIPRKSFFLNKWIKHGGWYPNFQMRLFKKDSVRVSDRLVHESFFIDGEKGKLKNDLLHYTVTSVKDYVNKINNYSDLSALEKAGKKQIGFLEIMILPGVAFFQQYIIKGNFLDGVGGLMVSKFHMMTKLLNNMKIWEMQNKNLKD